MSERTHTMHWYCVGCGQPEGDGAESLIVVTAKSREDAENRARVEAESRHRYLRSRSRKISSCTNDKNIKFYDMKVQ